MKTRMTYGVIGLAAAALALSACSSDSGTLPGESGGPTAAVDTTLTLGLSSDISAPDPSSAYNGSEMNLVLAAYEGLVKYQTGVAEAEIVPSLATEWAMSDDGLTYTFTLREGVTFHDGTPFTSAAVEPSIARMSEVGASGPGYMVADIASVETPDDTTVVFTLASANAAFLDYLASPFGLKMISPAALEEHGADEEWFAANDAGTGPFEYSSFDPGVSYALDAFDGYWGDAGGYDTVKFSVVDSTNTIQLQLESGELDGYIGSANKPLFDALSTTEGLATYTYPSMMAPVVFLNPNTSGFAEQTTRTDLLSGIDWDAIVSAVYGDLATPSTGVFPESMIDPSLNTTTISYDADALASLAEGALAGQTIQIGYPTFVPGAQEISDNVAAQLNTVGIATESVGYESSVYWSTIFDPEAAPDITLFSAFPDAAHPDTWARLLFSSEGGLNLFYAGAEGLDAILDEAVATDNPELYGQVSEIVSSSGYWYTAANLTVSAAYQDDVEGAAEASYPVLGITMDFTKLSPAS